jgi:hypothetical protein
MYLCRILLMWSLLCPFNVKKCKKLCYSLIAFLGEEYLDEILSASVMQSSLIIWVDCRRKVWDMKRRRLIFYRV